MCAEPFEVGAPVAVDELHVVSKDDEAPPAEPSHDGVLKRRCILMLVSAGMGVYHAGVEWHFWPGPATCSTTASSMTTNAGDLLGELNSIKGPSCTDAALRVLGLSFAGWNVIASLVLAAFAFIGVRKSA